MPNVDISVIVTAHNETVVAGPTVLSAEAACRAAEAGGFSVERLIVLRCGNGRLSRIFHPARLRQLDKSIGSTSAILA